MGITLTFQPLQPPSSNVESSLKVDCDALGPTQTWWSERPQLLTVPGIGVVGMMKVSMSGYSLSDGGYQDIDPQEDFLMMWRDIDRIATALSSWSVQHNIAWKITLEGEPFGAIDSQGNRSSELEAAMEELLFMSEAPTDATERATTVATIDAKYATRW